MKLISMISITALIFSVFAFAQKNDIVGLPEEKIIIDTPGEGAHILCRPPSRAVALQANVKIIAGKMNGHKEMVFIKGGNFDMGSNDFGDALPVHKVTVNNFWMDEHEVTNKQFAAFVKATGYITIAERKLNPADYPGVTLSKLVAGSAVFVPPLKQVSLEDPSGWWKYIAGASWKHPEGPGSTIKENDPVVQVCYTDALAYAKWAGKRLPTEAE